MMMNDTKMPKPWDPGLSECGAGRQGLEECR